jgi:hypothetical protein
MRRARYKRFREVAESIDPAIPSFLPITGHTHRVHIDYSGRSASSVRNRFILTALRPSVDVTIIDYGMGNIGFQANYYIVVS